MKHLATKKEYDFDWEEFRIIMDKLTDKVIKSNTKFDRILAVGRGGFVPGVVLSHKLNIKMMAMFADTYDDERRQIKDVVRISQITNIFDTKNGERINNVLIVDDIYDTGKTLKEIVEVIQRAGWAYKIAVMFSKAVTPMIHYTGMKVKEDIWVKMPWEVK